MKRKLLLLFQPICIGILIACTMGNKKEWKDEIAGTYTVQYEQPYSAGFDTLFISKMKNASGAMPIERRTGYQRKDASEAGTKYFKIENWVGIVDKIYPLLHIMPSGRELWFNQATGELTIGTTTYHRLK